MDGNISKLLKNKDYKIEVMYDVDDILGRNWFWCILKYNENTGNWYNAACGRAFFAQDAFDVAYNKLINLVQEDIKEGK